MEPLEKKKESMIIESESTTNQTVSINNLV